MKISRVRENIAARSITELPSTRHAQIVRAVHGLRAGRSRASAINNHKREVRVFLPDALARLNFLTTGRAAPAPAETGRDGEARRGASSRRIVRAGEEQKKIPRDDNPMRILDNKRGTLIIFAPRARSGTTVLKSVRN